MQIPTIRRHTAAAHGHEHPTVRLQAKWNGTVLADSEHTILLEGNHYFPAEDVSRDYLTATTEHSTCPWKGEASYYDVVVTGSATRAPGPTLRLLPPRPKSKTTSRSGRASNLSRCERPWRRQFAFDAGNRVDGDPHTSQTARCWSARVGATLYAIGG